MVKKKLRPIRPNLGLEIELRTKLRGLIDKMHQSISYWLSASYKKNEPVLAQDDVPALKLLATIRKLARQWRGNWNAASEDLAKYFAKSVNQRTDAELRAILKKAGIAVEFTITPAMRDVLHAKIRENVALIKSIPAEYLSKVETAVMRSVSTGRDLSSLQKEIESLHVVTKKRAALISRDQNNKMTATFNRVRQIELNLSARWLHSGAGKKPRPQHIEMHMKEYDPKKGMWDRVEKRFIFPSELINCRCVSQAILPKII